MPRFVVVYIACVGLAAALLPAGGTLRAQAKPGPPANFAALSAKADAARDANRVEEAASLYRQALALQPAWAEGWWALGNLEYERDSYAPAAAAFRKLAALAPQAGTAWALLGLCEFELGQEQQALAHLQQARGAGLGENPQLEQVVIFHEGLLLQRQGRFRQARQTLRSLCSTGARSPGLAQALGLVALLNPGKTPPAPGSLDAEVAARIGIAECLAGQKQNEEARRAYESVVKAHPDYPRIHYAYGWFLLDSWDVEATRRELDLEIKNNPRDVMSRLLLASALHKVDSAAGLPYAEQAVKLDPGLPLAHYYLGLLLLDTSDCLGAIPELELVQKASPSVPEVYLGLGAAYACAGRTEDAARARMAFQRLRAKGGQQELLPPSRGGADAAP